MHINRGVAWVHDGVTVRTATPGECAARIARLNGIISSSAPAIGRRLSLSSKAFNAAIWWSILATSLGSIVTRCFSSKSSRPSARMTRLRVGLDKNRAIVRFASRYPIDRYARSKRESRKYVSRGPSSAAISSPNSSTENLGTLFTRQT